MVLPLRSLLPLMLVVLFGAALPPAVAATTPPNDHQRHDLRCAAAFAVVAVAQTRGDAAALTLPPLGIRGKRYLGLIGARVAAETGLTGEAVRDLLAAEAKVVAHDGAPSIARTCLGELDAVAPPRPAPDAVTCVALLGVYADVLAARDAKGALGRTLAHEASILDPAARIVLHGRGLDGAAATAAIEQRRAQLRQALNGGPATIDADDFALCRHQATAKPG